MSRRGYALSRRRKQQYTQVYKMAGHRLLGLLSEAYGKDQGYVYKILADMMKKPPSEVHFEKMDNRDAHYAVKILSRLYQQKLKEKNNDQCS